MNSFVDTTTRVDPLTIILPNSYYILATMDPMARFFLKSYQNVSLPQDRILLR